MNSAELKKLQCFVGQSSTSLWYHRISTKQMRNCHKVSHPGSNQVYSFLHCFTDFNDYSMPILQTSDFTNYLNASKNIVASQWASFLFSHCNINRDCDGNHLTEYNERQVFITLLLLQRMSNLQSMT
jgi:hypothetical protein